MLSIKITNTLTKKSINVLDSQQIFDCSLRNLCKDFNTSTQKGNFPYKFTDRGTLSHIGDKPAFEYFNDISLDEWNEIKKDNWNAKLETQKYLRADLIGLLEALLIFSNFIHDKYNINITRYPTIPSIALAIFLSNRIDWHRFLKIIKGGCEKDIRSSYYAGLTNVFEHERKNGFMYDMVSQYPAAMKNPMPVGKGFFSI